MSTFVIVPVRGEWQLTEALLDSLYLQAFDDLLVLDNGSEDATSAGLRALRRDPWWANRMHIATRQRGKTIYEMWNHGFARARRIANSASFQVLVTNNDVILPRGAVDVLTLALRKDTSAWAAYPDYDAPWSDAVPVTAEWITRYTNGVLGSGGMSGCCFMLAGHRIPWRGPLITDPSYGHWYGDNHLAECIAQEGGGQARVVGLPILHVNEGTARHYPELNAVIHRDRGYWQNREARGRRAVNRR